MIIMTMTVMINGVKKPNVHQELWILLLQEPDIAEHADKLNMQII